MKLLHLADLHLGKRVNNFSMLEDQSFILEEILTIAKKEAPDAVLIAGDVYDRPVPPEEATVLFDRFLTRLKEMDIKVFIISGNHDSAERVAFGGRIMGMSGIYVSPVYGGGIDPVVLADEYGEVCFYLIPFMKPVHVRRFYPEAEIRTYTDAMAKVIEELHVDEGKRNVALVHQFITGGILCDSEEPVQTVGGTDEVSGTVFAPFDYVALGHLHGPQHVLRETMRYAGSPLKYSFSEINHVKSVTMVTLGEKGDVQVSLLPLTPLREMRRYKGTFAGAMGQFERLPESEEKDLQMLRDYYDIVLTDEEDVPEAMARLRERYPNIMHLGYDNTRTRHNREVTRAEQEEEKKPLALFAELYEKQNGQELSEAQLEFVGKLIEEIWDEH